MQIFMQILKFHLQYVKPDLKKYTLDKVIEEFCHLKMKSNSYLKNEKEKISNEIQIFRGDDLTGRRIPVC